MFSNVLHSPLFFHIPPSSRHAETEKKTAYAPLFRLPPLVLFPPSERRIALRSRLSLFLRQSFLDGVTRRFRRRLFSSRRTVETSHRLRLHEEEIINNKTSYTRQEARLVPRLPPFRLRLLPQLYGLCAELGVWLDWEIRGDLD